MYPEAICSNALNLLNCRATLVGSFSGPGDVSPLVNYVLTDEAGRITAYEYCSRRPGLLIAVAPVVLAFGSTRLYFGFLSEGCDTGYRVLYTTRR